MLWVSEGEERCWAEVFELADKERDKVRKWRARTVPNCTGEKSEHRCTASSWREGPKENMRLSSDCSCHLSDLASRSLAESDMHEEA